MSSDITVQQVNVQNVLKTSLYPGASDSSISMVLDYCRAAGLDPLQKPVHIVPMWDKNTGQMRDVIMPGIGLYRTQAARSDEYAGITEPEFGPDVTENIGGHEITYPLWCKITVKRKRKDGAVYDFTAKEFWKENYALKGGKDRSIAPNAMWARRPYGQIAKCCEAQALRKAFPEIGSQPTAEEMEGKSIGDDGNAASYKPTTITPDPVDAAKVSAAVVWLKEMIDADSIEDTWEKVQRGYEKLSNNERMAVDAHLKQKAPGSDRSYRNILKDYLNYKPTPAIGSNPIDTINQLAADMKK